MQDLLSPGRESSSGLPANGVRETQYYRAALAGLADALSHDLRNALFPMRLAHAILERRVGADPQLAAIDRASRAALRRLAAGVDACRELLEPEEAGAGPSDLDAAWSTAVDAALAIEPTAVVDAVVPSLEVAVDGHTLGQVLSILLTNAVLHGSPPIVARCSADAVSVRLMVANDGQLPFTDLAEVEPFRYRSAAGIGAGLARARRLAAAQGFGLTLTAAEGRVVATLTLPR